MFPSLSDCSDFHLPSRLCACTITAIMLTSTNNKIFFNILYLIYDFACKDTNKRAKGKR